MKNTAFFYLTYYDLLSAENTYLTES